MGALDSVKKIYFSLEDKYYELLDAVQKKIPVYSVVDPIDKVVPSFGVVLAVLFLVIGSGLFFIAGGISFAPENVTLSLSFNHEDGAPAEGVLISVNLAPEFNSPSPDLVFPLSKTTSAQGKVTFSLPPGMYVVEVEDEAFEPFSQAVELKESSSKIFSLKASAPQSASRSLLIQDSTGSILGIPTPVEILLNFSCQSGAPPLSQKVYSGNVSIQQPASCNGMSVTVSVNGFITKTQVILGDTTVISMQSSAALDDDDGVNPTPTTGTVEIFTKDVSSAGISGVQVKLYKVPPAGSNILADQSLSDSSGFSLFENASPGKYVAVASKQGYKQTTSVEFSVIAGETNTINLSLPVSSNKKKLFVKVLKQSDQTILTGSTVTLFVQSVGGKYLEYDSYTVDGNGLVNKELADFNGTTQLVVQRSNYITQILTNAGIFSNDETNALPILLESTAAASANGSISNGVVADVKVVDEINFPVYNADTYLYYPDINGVLIASKKTNAQGIARYTDLPEGSYQASASTKDFDGKSAKVEGTNGKIITLQVPLQVGSALVEVTVKTEQNQIIADANVSIVKLSNDVVQAKASTNAQGVAQLGVLSDQTVYVRVEKPGYLPFSSVPFDILKDNTHKILIEVSLTSATPSVDMALTSVYQISASGSQSLAQSISAGETYAFHFSIKSPSTVDDLQGVVRLNGTTPSWLPSDIGQILGAQVSKGSPSFYTTFTPSNEFAPKNPVSSGTPAKIALNDVGDVNGGAYEFIVLVKINGSAKVKSDKLKINYQSKSSSEKSALYESEYVIGETITGQQDFLYLFFLTKEGSEETGQISSGPPALPGSPAIVEANKNYTLTYLLTNVSGSNLTNAQLVFSGMDSDFTVNNSTTSTSVSLPGITNNSSFSGEVVLKSKQACSSQSPSCDTLTVTLIGGAAGKGPASQVIKIFTVPEKKVTLNASPSFLIPDKDNQVVQAVGLDNFNLPLTAAQGLQMVGQLLANDGSELGSSIPFTEVQNGVFIASIPSAPEGSALEITATASGYLSDVKTIPVDSSVVYSLSQDFSCVTITPPSSPFSLVENTIGTVKVSTNGCGEAISLFVEGQGSIYAPVKKGSSLVVNEASSITLGKTDSVDLSVTAPSIIGLYPLNFQAKFESQSEYSLVESLDLKVKPVSASGQCLDLSSYEFDLTQTGSATSVLVNNCNPLVQDAFLPSASVDNPSVYAHAVPPILTPQLQSPGAGVPFTWQVQVEYDFSTNSDTGFSDYLSSSDEHWTRYMLNDGTKFYGSKADFASADSVMKIPDSKQIGNNAQLENHSPTDFPHLPSNPKAEKSLLFETTLMVRSAVDLDAICVETEGMNQIRVLLDGVEVQDAKDGECSSIPGSMKNVKLTPGPHSFQIFIQDKDAGNYKIWVSYRDSVLTKGDWKPLSYQSATTGLWTSAQTDIPFSGSQQDGLFTNGTYEYPDAGPADNFVVPSLHHASSKYLDTLTGAVADILSNKSGVDHLKVAYPRFYSSDPQVRIFLKGLDVYAQFVGYDDPVSNGPKQQFVVVEDKDLVGTQYAKMLLTDYSTGSPSDVDLSVGVLVDASSSVSGEAFSLSSGFGTTMVGKQNGLCAILQNMENGLEYYSGADVHLKVFWIGKPAEYMNFPLTFPCSDMDDDLDMEFLNIVPPSPFDASLDSNIENWAHGAKVIASNSFWQEDWQKLLLVITDNKPLGMGPSATPDSWGGTEQEDAVDEAIDALQDEGIRSAVFYVTPLESTSTEQFDAEEYDAIEMYEKFSSETSPNEFGNDGPGLVEALEFPPFMSVSLANNPFMWEQSGHNKSIQRLAQHAFPVGYEEVIVKLVSYPQNVCIGENGEAGFTGASVKPKVLYNWDWDNVDADMCTRKDADPADYLYCDGLQFMISLTKRLQSLREAHDSNATNPNNALVAQIPELSQFDAYLMRDHFNMTMRDDLVEYASSDSFADFPDHFKSDLAGGAWKDYFSNPSNLSFVVNGDANLALLPASGLYRVSIEYTSPTFFSFGQPASNVTVSLNLLSDASALPGYSDFYEIPLDGRLGFNADTLEFEREGYGTAFTGYPENILAKPGGKYFLKTYPNASGFTALNTYAVNVPPSFEQLNASQNRGVVLEIDRLAKTFTMNPSVPTPVIAEWSSNNSGNGHFYYGIQPAVAGQESFVTHNTSNGPLAKWIPLASKKTEITLGCTDAANCAVCLDASSEPFQSAWVPDTNPPSSGVCTLAASFAADKTRAFGFTSSGGSANASYLGTVFYSDVQAGVPQTYSIWLACSAGTAYPGKLVIGSQDLTEGDDSTSLDMFEDPIFQSAYVSNWVLSDILALMETPTQVGDEQGWSCLSNGGNKTTVYWNRDELHEYASAYAASSFSDFVGSACTSAGTPFQANGTYTLTYENDASIGTLSQSNVDALCPLWNEKPAFNYYGQSGIPYPEGTQRYLTSGSPSTGDPLDSLVQYRDDPTSCPTGATIQTATCGTGTFGSTFKATVCQNNDEWVWSND